MNIKEISFDDNDIILFNSAFIHNLNNKGGWSIKVNGNFIKVKSGRSIWRQKSHAYLALINHLYGSFVPRQFFQKYFNSNYFPIQKDFQEKDFWRLLISFLEEKKIVEFVELK